MILYIALTMVTKPLQVYKALRITTLIGKDMTSVIIKSLTLWISQFV